MMQNALRLPLPDEAATIRLGADIAACLAIGDVVALTGDLGAGKSTLARAIIRSLAGDEALDVPSPTFTIVQSYDARLPVWHADFYRLSSPDDLGELGLDDAERGVLLVEWPERAASALREPSLAITLETEGDGRVADIAGAGVERLSRSIAIRSFLEQAGWGAAQRRFLMGDASARSYETVTLPGEPVRILMNAPRKPDGPPIRDGLPYSRIAHLAESVEPFVAIGRALSTAGFSAPAIHAADLERGLLLIEHLGSDGLLDANGRPIAERYEAASALLASVHAIDWPDALPLDGGGTYDIPPYDRGALSIETELLPDWYLPAYGGAAATKSWTDAFRKAWDAVIDDLRDAETSLVLRDYHSPNIIWREDRTGLDRVGIIDFQDALRGPSAYDVASLGQDARVTVPPALEARVVAAYVAARATAGSFDRDGFDFAYAAMAAQRNTKILGIFVRLDRRDGKPGYLKHLPRIRDYLKRALAHPRLGALAALYAEAGIFDTDPRT